MQHYYFLLYVFKGRTIQQFIQGRPHQSGERVLPNADATVNFLPVKGQTIQTQGGGGQKRSYFAYVLYGLGIIHILRNHQGEGVSE